jgi:hypothetical protein
MQKKETQMKMPGLSPTALLRHRKRGPGLRFLFLLLVMLSVSFVARAEIMLAGTYYGRYAETQWGSKVLYNGAFHVFVSDDAAKVLEEHRGKLLKVEVSSVSQPINPGAGMIEGIHKVTHVQAANGLELSAKVDASRVPQWDGITLRLSLRNISKKPIHLSSDDFAIVFATDSPGKMKGCQAPTDVADWDNCYSYYSSLDQSMKHAHNRLLAQLGQAALTAEFAPLTIACHKIQLRSLQMPLSFTKNSEPYPDGELRFGKGASVRLAPKEVYEITYRVGTELPPDDYEVYVYRKSRNRSVDVTSNRLSFDVIERKPGDGLPESAEILQTGSGGRWDSCAPEG